MTGFGVHRHHELGMTPPEVIPCPPPQICRSTAPSPTFSCRKTWKAMMVRKRKYAGMLACAASCRDG